MRGRSSKTSVRPSCSPRIVTFPDVGCTSVSASCRSVVLPAPLGPRIDPPLVVVDRPVEVVDDVPGVSADDDVGELEHLRHAVSLSADAGDLRVQRGRRRRRSSAQLKSFVARSRPAAPYAAARSGSLTTSVRTRARSSTYRSGSQRGAGAVLHLLDRHQPAGHAVDDDLGDAAGRRADDRGAARHRLEVHDAERLVDRRADERRRGAEDRAQLVARQHPIDPDDALARLLQPAHEPLDLGHDLRSVRARPRTGPPARRRGSRSAARRKYGSPFCRVIRPTKTTDGFAGSMPSSRQQRADPRPDATRRRRCRCR